MKSMSGPRNLFIFLALISILALNHPVRSVAAPTGIVPLETFEGYQLFTYPEPWKVRGDQQEARAVYQIMVESGNHFLHARADRQAIQIGLLRVFSPQDFPRLRWRWRVAQLPPGGDEGRKETHDSAAGVYVIFDNQIFPRVIKYVWSSTLPVGTHVQNPLYWRAKIVVLKSGPANLGQWHQETVNFYQDYQDLFGERPGKVQGIGLATSSTATQSLAIADYDDFTLLDSEALLKDKAVETVAQ